MVLMVRPVGEVSRLRTIKVNMDEKTRRPTIGQNAASSAPDFSNDLKFLIDGSILHRTKNHSRSSPRRRRLLCSPIARSRDGLVIPPYQESRAVQAEFLEVRPRLQLRRAGSQSRGERQGEEVRSWRDSRHRALLPVG